VVLEANVRSIHLPESPGGVVVFDLATKDVQQRLLDTDGNEDRGT
jgi:hypothetical protein